MSDLQGINLESISEPIRAALSRYSEESDGKVEFDLDGAAKLELTPDKPYSARSATEVRHLGETVTTLYVIAFAEEDGTGDESTYKLKDSISGGLYPLQPKSVPRSKAGVDSEAHLTIASYSPYSPNEDPIMFAGRMDLISLRNGRFSRLAILGQNGYDFTEATFRHTEVNPTATFTTGYTEPGHERFGDPHAVFNSQMFVQVCGFVAVSSEVSEAHRSLTADLGAQVPQFAF